MSLTVLSNKLGIINSDLEKLLSGIISVGVASKIGIATHCIQEFIDGKESIGFSNYLGMTIQNLYDFRNMIGREGAIGFILGLLSRK